jgi:hypothetical protein
MERTFFILGFCPPSIQAVWRGFNADSVLPNYFSGDLDLAKPRLISRPQKGVWGMNAGGISLRIFSAAAIEKIILKCYNNFTLEYIAF